MTVYIENTDCISAFGMRDNFFNQKVQKLYLFLLLWRVVWSGLQANLLAKSEKKDGKLC